MAKKIDVEKIIATAKQLEYRFDYNWAALYYDQAAKILEERAQWIRAAELFEQEAHCFSTGLELGDISSANCPNAREACLKAESLYGKSGRRREAKRTRRLREDIDRIAESHRS